METLVLDASVLIGLLDTADAHHGKAIDDVEAADRQRKRLLLPASAYSETLVAFARAGRIDEARRSINAMGITVVALTDTIAELAAELRARHHSLRLPDAMVLATSQEHRGSLLSYDRRLSQLAET